LNLDRGETAPNLVVAPVGVGGKVCVFTQSGAHLVADLSGYVPAGARFEPLVPVRVLETRVSEGQRGYSGAKPVAGQTVELVVAGVGGVPAGARAVVLNVTGVEASGAGFVTVWPCGSARPTASNLNLDRGETAPNLVVAPVGVGGKVCVFTQSGAHLLADLSGYFT
jgi:hypothetical protein